MQAANLLKSLGIEYTPLTEEQILAHKKEWIHRLLPLEKHEKAVEIYCIPKEDGYSDYLWHAFSFELLEGLCGDAARQGFNNICRGEAILLSNWDDAGYHIPDTSALTADELEKIADIVLTSTDFQWTYAKTHESDLGPYLFKIEQTKRAN